MAKLTEQDKKTFTQEKENLQRQVNKMRTSRVQLPGLNRPVKKFIKDIATAFKESEDIFYKPNENIVVEIGIFYDKMLRREITTFRKVTPKRFFNILESKVTTYMNTQVKREEGLVWVEKDKSVNETICAFTLENQNFLEALNPVNRFLHYPLIFLDGEGKVIIPKIGYDARFQAYFTKEAPKIKIMEVEKAKRIINEILEDFCFKEKVDEVMAWAYLITPACRGLYKTITARSPIFLIKANRERAGKDYLAGVVGLIYEGLAIDDPPICTGDRGTQNNEELRKKVTSAIRQGRRRIHSSNNRGHLQNAVLEQLSTSETWRDRELGKNTELTLDNELDISLSANIGITYTPDFWHRCRPINLFFSEENPNARTFSKPNLWGYVKDNRDEIISAIYTLVVDWVDKGMVEYEEAVFTSFPEWARVVGSVMMHHKIGNPCEDMLDDAIGGDRETKDMKKFFEYMSGKEGNEKGHTPKELMDFLQEYQEEESIFTHLDFGEKKYRVRFGLLLQKYLGREFGGVVMRVDNPEQRAARRRYIFDFLGKNVGKGGKDGLSQHPQQINQKSKNNIIGKIPTFLTHLTKDQQENLRFTQTEQIIQQTTKKEYQIPKEDLLNFIRQAHKANGKGYKEDQFVAVYGEEIMEKLLGKGDVMRRPGGYLVVE